MHEALDSSPSTSKNRKQNKTKTPEEKPSFWPIASVGFQSSQTVNAWLFHSVSYMWCLPLLCLLLFPGHLSLDLGPREAIQRLSPLKILNWVTSEKIIFFSQIRSHSQVWQISVQTCLTEEAHFHTLHAINLYSKNKTFFLNNIFKNIQWQ